MTTTTTTPEDAVKPEKLLERAAAARTEAVTAEVAAVKARDRMVGYMRRARDAGAGYEQIARAVGISKQRVGQLFKTDIAVTAPDGEPAP